MAPDVRRTGNGAGWGRAPMLAPDAFDAARRPQGVDGDPDEGREIASGASRALLARFTEEVRRWWMQEGRLSESFREDAPCLRSVSPSALIASGHEVASLDTAARPHPFEIPPARLPAAQDPAAEHFIWSVEDLLFSGYLAASDRRGVSAALR